MSKIEKALTKARRDRATALVPLSSRRSDTHSKQPEPNTPKKISESLVVASEKALERSRELIANMQEIEVLDRQQLIESNIIHPGMDVDPTVQAFRELRTKILKRTKGRNCTVMVATLDAGGGSTFVTMNLGAAFAFDSGKTALLVDCNLRQPWFHNLFRNDDTPGLKDYLEGNVNDVAEIIHPVGIERVRVIPSGGSLDKPAEHFTSPKLRSLIEHIRQRYPERYIFLDAPPMTASADSRILADICDYVLLVVPYGKITKTRIDECVSSIEKDKFLGLVFNNAPRLPVIDWKMILGEPQRLLQEALRSYGTRFKSMFQKSKGHDKQK